MIGTLISTRAYIRQRSILTSRKPSTQLITRFYRVNSNTTVLEARNLDGSIPTLPTEANFAGSTDKYLAPSLSIVEFLRDPALGPFSSWSTLMIYQSV